MNLWLRLIWYLVTAWRRPALEATHAVSTLRFRVWPTDLDLSLHMNNGRYLTLMDLGRLDFMVRTGLWRPLLRHRWTPIASGIAIRFRRELIMFDAVELETRLMTWSDVTVVMEQVIRFASGPRQGQVASRALFKGGLYDRQSKSFVTIARLMDEIGVDVEAPALTPDVEAFLKSDEAIRATEARSAGGSGE
jgi:acyl-CoA thioesterase FadM